MRKYITTTTVFVLSGFISNAQITEGTTWLGGSIGLYKRENKGLNDPNNTNKQTTFSFSPAIGKAVKENTILGFNLHYELNKAKYNNNQSTREGFGYGAGSLYRRYAHLGRNFYLFGQGTINFGLGKTEDKGTNTYTRITKGWNINAAFHPGLSYALTRKLHLEAGFSNLLFARYGHDRTEEKGTNLNRTYKGNEFQIGASLENLSSLFLGLRLLLPK